MITASNVTVQMDPNAIPKSAMGSKNGEESFDRSIADAEAAHTLRLEQNASADDRPQRRWGGRPMRSAQVPG